MLLKPSEVEYVELQEEVFSFQELQEGEETESEPEIEQEQEPVPDERGIVFGKTVLIGGTEEPIFLDDDINFSVEEEEEEFEFVFGEPITIGSEISMEYSEEESSDDFSSEFDTEVDSSLYDLDTDFDLDSSESFYSDQELSGEMDLEGALDFGESSDTPWEETKHKTLMGRVDSQLLDKIREYRENIQEMSDEKLSALSTSEERDRLLLEAAQLVEDIDAPKDINQVISEIDFKLSKMVKKYTDQQHTSIERERDRMLQEVEEEVDKVINDQIEVIKSEAEEHIEETIQYYKKKLESDNQVLSSANNIISRREQILDEAYAKSLSIVEDSEDKARQIIESSAHAQEEAEAIIAEYERRGEEIRQEAELEAERIISDANVESARIIQAAEDQHQDIVDAATQDGFSVGYQEGKEEALKENSELLREAMNALNKLHAAFPVAVKQNEEKMIKLAYQIAQSVLGEPSMERDEMCQKVLYRSIKVVSDLDVVKIKVNPTDLDVILPKQEYFKAIIPDVQEFIITGDAFVTKGNAVINTSSEKINISINTQLSILEAVFSEAISEMEGEEAY